MWVGRENKIAERILVGNISEGSYREARMGRKHDIKIALRDTGFGDGRWMELN
jgi:hypothetical protein